jgi:peptidoglycan/xylan/chitin deacetylase (PgdA/CDA1 family)
MAEQLPNIDIMRDPHSPDRLDRREFLSLFTGTVVAVTVGGDPIDIFRDPRRTAFASAVPHGIDDGAVPYESPIRGTQTQVTPPPLQPRTWRDGDFINSVLLPSSEKHFAFTIDDGPSPYNTEPILRALEYHKVFATFFLVGVNVQAWPDIARRIRDAGHEIGNHSVYHDPYYASALASQIPLNQEIIKAETGITPVANRAPGLTRGWQILEMVRKLGMYELHTTLNQNDWQSPRWPVEKIIDELYREIRNGGFSLNHDGGGPRPTAAAFTHLIDLALSQDYQIHRSTDMINLGTPLPGHNSYDRARRSPRDAREPRIYRTKKPDFCKYSPKVELKTRLEDPHTKRQERSRIVGALADIQAREKLLAAEAK